MKTTAKLARMVAPIACALIAAGMTAMAAGPTGSVDWTKAVRTVDPRAYGVNCPQCFDPNWTANQKFLNALSGVTGGGKPIIRLHGWGMVSRRPNRYNQGWLNSDGTWNAPKIKSALTPLFQAGYKLLINIPSGPGGEGDIKDPAAFASFTAELVKIVNVDNRFGVKYWEIPNEGETRITAAQMATLLSGASKAMKAVDPTILVGGPATAGVKIDYIAQIVQETIADLDFVSCHTYGGSGKQADDVSYASAKQTRNDIASLRARLDGVTHGKKYLPIFLDEYNIGWDSTPNIRTNVGAVYFVIVQGGVVDGGGDVSAVWDYSPGHDMSIAGDDCGLYPSANLFTLMNRYFYGKEAAASASDESIYVYAVEASATHSVVLANLEDSEQQVGVSFRGWKPLKFSAYEISPAGYSGPKPVQWPEITGRGIAIPGKSVTVLVSQ